MKMRRDMVTGIVGLLTCVFFCFMTLQVRQPAKLLEPGPRLLPFVALFLIGIFPLLFVPAAAGVMELWAEMGEMLLPIVIAIIPVTVLVLVSAGRTTQALTSRRAAKKEAEHD